MKKLVLSAALATLVFVGSYGQQDAMYSQYMFNQMNINPAYAGNHEVLNSCLLFRNQWVGIEGAPKTQAFSIDATANNKDKVGLGLTVYNDKIGITKKTGVYLTYSYRIKFRKSTLAFGLQGGVSHLKANFSEVQYSYDNTGNDPAFSYNLDQYAPNFGTGVFFNTKKFYAGFSVPTLLRKSLFEKNNIQGYRQYQHYFLTTGYVIDLNDDIKVKPSVLAKYVEGAPVEFDFNANVWFYDAIAIGASYRTGDSFLGMIELSLNKQLKLGYAYDYSVTELNRYNYGSHEIMLRYEFTFNRSRMITPRYF